MSVPEIHSSARDYSIPLNGLRREQAPANRPGSDHREIRMEVLVYALGSECRWSQHGLTLAAPLAASAAAQSAGRTTAK